MPVELRKRKEPASQPAAAPPAKKKGPVAKAVGKVRAIMTSASPKVPSVGETIDFAGRGLDTNIETHDGLKTTLKELVDESKAGVVIFTYPRASTPGC